MIWPNIVDGSRNGPGYPSTINSKSDNFPQVWAHSRWKVWNLSQWSLTHKNLIQPAKGLKMIIGPWLIIMNLHTEQPECTVYYLQLFAFSSALALQNYDPACLTALPWLCNRMPPTLLSQLIAIKTTTGIWNIENLFSCRIAANNFTLKPFTTRYHYI